MRGLIRTTLLTAAVLVLAGCSRAVAVDEVGGDIVWDRDAFIAIDGEGNLRRSGDGRFWAGTNLGPFAGSQGVGRAAALLGLCPDDFDCGLGLGEVGDASDALPRAASERHIALTSIVDGSTTVRVVSRSGDLSTRTDVTLGPDELGLRRFAATDARLFHIDDGQILWTENGTWEPLATAPAGNWTWIAAHGSTVGATSCDDADRACELFLSGDDGASWSAPVPFEGHIGLAAGPAGIALLTEAPDGSDTVVVFDGAGDVLADTTFDAAVFEIDRIAVGNGAVLLVGWSTDDDGVSTRLLSAN